MMEFEALYPFVIKDNAFEGTFPRIIVSHSETPPIISKTAFTDYSATLYVPKKSLSKYQEHDVWSRFAYIKEIPSDGEVCLILNECDLTIGETGFLRAVILDEKGCFLTNKLEEISYKSYDNSILKIEEIEERGRKIKALKKGKATIEASCPYEYYTSSSHITTILSSICVVNISPPEILASSISLDHTNIELIKGKKIQLHATIEPVETIYKEISWSSSEPSVASVDSDGVVTAITEGTAQIIARTQDSSDLVAVCDIKVKSPEVLVSSLTLIPQTITAKEGDQIQMQPMALKSLQSVK